MLHGYIPGLPQKTYEYRRGDSQVIYDDKKSAILIDGGEGDLWKKMRAFLEENGLEHVTFVLSHWHPDHDCALRSALESSYVIVDKIYCPPISELLTIPDGKGDYSRASNIIALAKRLRKTIEYIPANKTQWKKVGAIRMWMWRRKANKGDYVNYQVNNTSVACYFPDLAYWTMGDAITSDVNYFKSFKVKRPIIGFKQCHHGNAEGEEDCQTLEAAGAKICWYSDWEPKGVSIGGTSFSKYGARQCDKHFVTLRPFQDITFEGDGKTVTWKQGSQKWTYTIDGTTPASTPTKEPDPPKAEDPDIVVHANTGFKGYNVSERKDPDTHAYIKPKYIVIHYVGAESTAKANVAYFNAANRDASADFFVGHDGEIWQYNPNIKYRYSWHCGGPLESSHHPLHGICTNRNSIGVELCTKKKGTLWTFSKETVESAVLLTKYLMKTYGIPASNVVRHYDVTGKACPRVSGWGAVGGSSEWTKFKAALAGSTAQLYRVRKAWADAGSQLGAFSELENARALAAKHAGYKVFDSSGKEVK